MIYTEDSVSKGIVDITMPIVNLLYTRFGEVDFEYNRLTEEEKIWCSSDEFSWICKFINETRVRV